MSGQMTGRKKGKYKVKGSFVSDLLNHPVEYVDGNKRKGKNFWFFFSKRREKL
jgi:hypothetical protein